MTSYGTVDLDNMTPEQRSALVAGLVDDEREVKRRDAIQKLNEDVGRILGWRPAVPEFEGKWLPPGTDEGNVFDAMRELPDFTEIHIAAELMKKSPLATSFPIRFTSVNGGEFWVEKQVYRGGRAEYTMMTSDRDFGVAICKGMVEAFRLRKREEAERQKEKDRDAKRIEDARERRLKQHENDNMWAVSLFSDTLPLAESSCFFFSPTL